MTLYVFYIEVHLFQNYFKQNAWSTNLKHTSNIMSSLKFFSYLQTYQFDMWGRMHALVT